MTIAFHFFSQYWHFIKCITLPIYRLPTLLQQQKEGFKAILTWFFSPSFPCTSGAPPVTQSGTTLKDNRGPNYPIFACIYVILSSFADTSLHIEMVLYCASYIIIERVKLHISRKGKGTPLQNMKALGGCGCKGPHIHSHGTRKK